jgi:hypothetical protein
LPEDPGRPQQHDESFAEGQARDADPPGGRPTEDFARGQAERPPGAPSDDFAEGQRAEEEGAGGGDFATGMRDDGEAGDP